MSKAQQKRNHKKAVQKYLRTPKGKFAMQKHNARRRGIPFLITFEQWASLWGSKLNRRGTCARCLVMARTGDKGPYAVGNVSIITFGNNIREARAGRRVKRRSRVSSSYGRTAKDHRV